MMFVGLFSALISVAVLFILKKTSKKNNDKESYLAVLFSVLITLFSVNTLNGFVANFYWGSSDSGGGGYHDSVARVICDGFVSKCIFKSIATGYQLDVFSGSVLSKEEKGRITRRVSDLKNIFLVLDEGEKTIIEVSYYF